MIHGMVILTMPHEWDTPGRALVGGIPGNDVVTVPQQLWERGISDTANRSAPAVLVPLVGRVSFLSTLLLTTNPHPPPPPPAPSPSARSFILILAPTLSFP